MFDDVFYGCLLHLDVASLAESVCLLGLLDEVAAGYFYLLLGAVSAHLDELHAVEQRAGYLADVVGRGYEHDLREVVVHVEEVVVEGGVLFGVEHFEQGRGWVAVHGASADFVYLVEYEDGVVGAGLDDVLQYASGHGSDVGAPVSAYLGLVVQSAQAGPDVLALQCRCYAAPQRGLADARWAVEAEDGRLHVAPELQHGQVLQYALLDLLHAVVVGVEHALGVLYVQVVLGVFLPGQLQYGLQVVQLDVVVGALRVDALQLGESVEEGLAGVLWHLLGLHALAQLFGVLGGAGSAQFVLYVLNLLLQEPFALLAVHLHVCLLQDAVLHVHQRLCRVDALYEACRALLHDGHLQHVLLVLLLQGQAGAEEVDHEDLVGDVHDGKLGLVGQVLVGLDVVYGSLSAGVGQDVEFDVVRVGIELRELLHGGLHVGFGGHGLAQAYAARGLQYDAHLPVGQFEQLHHACHHARWVEVVPGGVLGGGVFLAEGSDERARLVGMSHHLERAFPPDGHGRHDAWEHGESPQWQYGQYGGYGLLGELSDISLKIGDKGEWILYLFFAHFYLYINKSVQRYEKAVKKANKFASFRIINNTHAHTEEFRRLRSCGLKGTGDKGTSILGAYT